MSPLLYSVSSAPKRSHCFFGGWSRFHIFSSLYHIILSWFCTPYSQEPTLTPLRYPRIERSD